MQWFYVENGNQAGPVDEAQLADLVSAGRVNSGTLVWKEGMANWLPYASVMAGTAPPAVPSAVAMAGSRACAQCGLVFPESEVVPLAGAFVCAGCKPVALQRMREGTWMTGSRRYAGFWIRFAALLIDGLILFAAQVAITLVLGAGFAGMFDLDDSDQLSGAAIRTMLLVWALMLGLGVAYQVFFITKYGATPGKMVFGLQLVRGSGGALSPMRIIGRMFAHVLSALILYIGYIIAAFDKEKRALHDHICDTRVIYKS